VILYVSLNGEKNQRLLFLSETEVGTMVMTDEVLTQTFSNVLDILYDVNKDILIQVIIDKFEMNCCADCEDRMPDEPSWCR
jgi:hypothetical protein